MHYPASFYLTMLIVCGLVLELWRQRRASWALPALMVYVTVLAWYYADPILYGEKYKDMPWALLDYSYLEVLIFVLAFRWITPHAAEILTPRKPVAVPTSLKPSLLLYCAIPAWAGLFLCAVARMDWDVLGALFPMEGRNGNLMWLRAAAGDAGPTGFLVSTGGYLYLVTCAAFGILIVFLRTLRDKLVAGGMMALTWPFFLLCGTRNQFLAVAMPWMFCYLLFGRQKPIVRAAALLACFLFLNFAFKVVINYRNVGLSTYFLGKEDELTGQDMADIDVLSGHEGLNMIQELCFINGFLSANMIDLTFGQDYLVQATGFIPRAIWPGKPLMGIEYAKLRGFEGGDSDIGVVATISSGLIGQGVLEFGRYLGPMAPAILLAAWCGLLARWWQQRVSFLRLILFLLGLGVTFNLGRDITNMAFWPVTFAYLLVVLAERNLRCRRMAALVRKRTMPGKPHFARPAGLPSTARLRRLAAPLPTSNPGAL